MKTVSTTESVHYLQNIWKLPQHHSLNPDLCCQYFGTFGTKLLLLLSTFLSKRLHSCLCNFANFNWMQSVLHWLVCINNFKKMKFYGIARDSYCLHIPCMVISRRRSCRELIFCQVGASGSGSSETTTLRWIHYHHHCHYHYQLLMVLVMEHQAEGRSSRWGYPTGWRL